jgi:uncharacterized repeat protein (TIGR01451 family)
MMYPGVRAAVGARNRASRALAVAVFVIASALAAPLVGAAGMVRNVATATHTAPGANLVHSNEVTLEIASTQTSPPPQTSQFSFTVTSDRGQVVPGQVVTFTGHIQNGGNQAAPPSDPYRIDGVAATGAFALTAVPAGAVLTGVQNVTLYHYAGEPAGDFQAAAPADLTQVDAVGTLLARVPASGSLDFSFTVRPLNVAATYGDGVLLRVAPTVNLGGVPTAWLPVTPAAVAKVLGTAARLTAYSDKAVSHALPYLLLGSTAYLRLEAQACNSDPTAVVSRTATLLTTSGDMEQLVATETAPNSNVFLLAPLVSQRGQPQTGSGRIESPHNETITVQIEGCLVPISLDLQLIDPSGIVFDSATNQPLDDMNVSLLKANGTSCTTEPASVLTLDENGALVPSPNPSRTRDGGHYQFPLVPAGTYCLLVESANGYTFASAKPVASLPQERRLGNGSFGRPFPVGPALEPVLLDLPVDPATAQLGLFVDKRVSRNTALVGEQLLFTVQVKNVTAKPVTALRLIDAMSAGLSYLPGSLRLNDIAVADPKIAGGVLTVPLADLGASLTHTLSYRTAISPSAPATVRNSATAAATGLGSNTASVTIEVRRGFETDSKGVLTGTVYLACEAKDVNANPGVPGIRLLLEDGTAIVTDNQGRYSRYGLGAGTHVLKLDPASLPEHARLVASGRDRGSGLAFIDLRDGELFKHNIALECTDETQEQVHARAARRATPEVFRALDRAFSATVTAPVAGGVGAQPAVGNSASTGSVREQLATVGRDGIASTRDTTAGRRDEGSDSDHGQRPSDARSAAPIAPDAGTALESALLGISDNEAAFLNLQDEQVLPISTVAVQVKAPTESTLTLRLNGEPLRESQIGQRSIYRDKAVMGLEYVGIKLKPGVNLLTLEQKDQFGNVRRKVDVRVRAPGDLAQISIVPVASPLYAGDGGRALVRIRLLDAEGVPVTARLPVKLETERGSWLIADAGSRAGAGQIFIEGGQADVAITQPVQAMRVSVTATSGTVVATEVLDFLPQLRPIIAVGVAETVIRFKSGQAMNVVPTTSLDAFSRELRGLSLQFSGQASAAARAAVFLKGKVRGDYLLTLAYDSDKPTRDRLFRDISPDEFYPIYGDDSTRTFDAQTAGKLYVRIEKGHSWALVGDFVTDLQTPIAPRPVLSSYTRPVTGAATHIEQAGVVMDAFALRDVTRQQVFEFAPNGTSGPYPLPIGNLVANTERVELVVRDRLDPAVILTRTTLTRFDDYELEALSGRILFKSPVSAFNASQNLVYVRVTFEVDTGQAAYTTIGGQISTRLGDRATVAARLVHEANTASPYTLQGAIVQVDVTPKLKVSGEIARSQRGGDVGAGSGTAGRIEVKGQAGPVELIGTATATSDHFENLSSGISPSRRDVAVTASMPLSADTKLVARVTAGRDTRTGAQSEVAYAGVETPVGPDLRLEAGVRMLKEDAAVFADTAAVPGPDPHREATTARVKLSAQLASLPELTGYVEAEQSLTDAQVRQAVLGVNYQLSSGTRFYARHEFVNTLPVLSSTSTLRQTTAVGIDSAYSNTGRAFAEMRQTINQGLSGPATAYGLRESWELRKGLRFSAGLEKVQALGRPTDLAPTINTTAITTALDVNIAENWRATGRIERATGQAESSTLVTAAVALRLAPSWTALAREVDFRSQPHTAGAALRVQSRQQLGMALRTVEDDALLLLEHYREPVENGERDSAIVSAQYGRALTTSLRMSLRVAGRRSLESLGGARYRSYAALAGGRLTYEVSSKWNLGLQAQSVVGSSTRSSGLGLEVGYRVTEQFWVVAGYNWMTATDPVLQGPQNSHGAYIRVRYMFDESVLDAFPQLVEPAR